MSLCLTDILLLAHIDVNMRKYKKFDFFFSPDKNTFLKKVIIESELSVTQKEPVCVNTYTYVSFRLFRYRIACMMGL